MPYDDFSHLSEDQAQAAGDDAIAVAQSNRLARLQALIVDVGQVDAAQVFEPIAAFVFGQARMIARDAVHLCAVRAQVDVRPRAAERIFAAEDIFGAIGDRYTPATLVDHQQRGRRQSDAALVAEAIAGQRRSAAVDAGHAGSVGLARAARFAESREEGVRRSAGWAETSVHDSPRASICTTMAVMLSGPPAALAASIRLSQAVWGEGADMTRR